MKIFSSGINKFLMSPVVNLMVKKERYEGDFRFQHVFIRVNSESLAFYGKEAENAEEKTLDKKLGDCPYKLLLLNNISIEFFPCISYYVILNILFLINWILGKLCNTQEKMTGRQFILDCSTNMFDYFGAIASYVVIAIPIFAGVYDNLDEPALSEGKKKNISLLFQ